MQVYKLEPKNDPCGFGVNYMGWQACKHKWCKVVDNWHLDSHPGVRDDPAIDAFHSGMVVGCESIRQLMHWFPYQVSVKEQLNTLGVNLVIYEVDDDKVQKGTNQLVFHKDNATLISCENWEEAFKRSKEEYRNSPNLEFIA